MLKPFSAVVLISFYCLWTIGCGAGGAGGDPQVELANKMMAAMDEFGNTLASINDEKSAEAAKGKLEALATTINSLVEQGKKLGEPSPEIKAKFDAQLQEKTKAMAGKMAEFAKNAMTNPKIMEIIAPVMEKMSSKK